MVHSRVVNDLEYEEARELFDYDAKAGVLYNKRWRGHNGPGSVAAHMSAEGYLRLTVRRRSYLAHRLVWLLAYGVWPVDQLDHIDRDKSNNRLSNLRECDTSENHQNQEMTTRKGTSRYIGVCKPSGRDGWRAFIGLRKKQVHLGTFRCETAAYVAYCKAKAQMHEFVLSDRSLSTET